MALYEVDLSAVIEVNAESAEEARSNVVYAARLWLRTKSLVALNATLIKEGDN